MLRRVIVEVPGSRAVDDQPPLNPVWVTIGRPDYKSDL